MRDDPRLKQALIDKGVILHAPASSLVADLDPERIEAGVEIFPGSSVVGSRTLLGAGTRLGRAGGGWFEDLQAGRQVEVFGGFCQDCVLLDRVRIRGQAELRFGTLLEEASSAAHHVGLKMAVLLPRVTLGSLVNLADVLVAGGRGGPDFTEIGSVFALYNYSPQGDKWASRFGDVPEGVFLRSPRIFVGGQAQIVSPVHIGYGSVVAAGGGLRHDLPAGRLAAEAAPVLDRDFDPARYGPLHRKLLRSAELIGNLAALCDWYDAVRIPLAAGDPLRAELFRAARRQIEAGARERVARLDALVGRLPASQARHEAALDRADPEQGARHQACLAEHAAILASWPRARTALLEPWRSNGDPAEPALQAIASRLAQAMAQGADYLASVRDALDPAAIESGRAVLQRRVDRVVQASGFPALANASQPPDVVT